MTQQLARGARQAMDRVSDEIADAREALELLLVHAYDRHYTIDRGGEIEQALNRLERLLKYEIEPMLVRREPTTEQRLADLEERIATLEAERQLRR